MDILDILMQDQEMTSLKSTDKIVGSRLIILLVEMGLMKLNSLGQEVILE